MRKTLPAKRSPKNAASPRARFTELNQLRIKIPLGGYQSEVLYWGFYDAKYWRNYLHTHSFFEICYAWKGTGTFRMPGRDHRIKAGDLFIARPGEPHEIISSRRDPLGIYYWAFSLKRGRLADSSPSPVDVLMDRFTESQRWVVEAVPGIAATLNLLTDEIRDRFAGYPLGVDALVTKLLLDTGRAVVSDRVGSEVTDPPAKSEAHAIVETASRYIRDNLGGPISLRDVAAQVHVSERHLGRLFQQIRQTTVLDYITRVRISTACALLLDHQWAVKKIAAVVGYPDVRYFTTVFGKQMKLTPAVFRKRGGTAFADEALRNKWR